MAAGTQTVHQRIAVDALDGGLPRGVDIGDDHRAGVVHAGAEFSKERFQPGVAVWLHDRDHVPRAGLAGGFQHRRDLYRVVAVIVDHGDTAGLPGFGKPALDALEPQERGPQGLVVHLHFHADGDGGQGVLHVVRAQHRQPERPEAAVPPAMPIRHHHMKTRPQFVRNHMLGANIRLGGEPVGHDPMVRQPRDHLLNRGVVDAQHGKPIERNVSDELVVPRDHFFLGAPVIQMFWIHVRHDGDDRRQSQKTAIAFVGLDDHPLTLAQAGVGAVGVDDAAIDDGGIEFRCLQHRRHQAGGGGLAVRAADRDGPFQPHQFGEHFRPPHDRDEACPSGLDLGIVFLDGGGGDDDLRPAEVRRVVPDGHLDAGRAQPQHVGGFGNIAALHDVAEVVQHLGDAGHADAADAHEMDGADGQRQRSHARAS